jgi:pimeloyl-ACP methyl ester carboxylesterase
VTKLILRLILMLLAWLLGIAAAPGTTVWTVIAVDPEGDGRDASLADAAQLSYRYDDRQDVLWFRVTMYGKPNEEAVRVKIAVDAGAGLTATVTRGAVQPHNLQIAREGDSILIGVKRTHLTGKRTMNVVAAVGSDEVWNDEIPNSRSAAIDLTAPRPSRGLRELDVDRNNLRFPADYRTLADSEPPRIRKAGRGRDTMILVPGVYSGEHAFDGFIERNRSRYTFFVVTPPGLNGTPARPLPAETISYGELTWTRRLERDILGLIEREALEKPVVVAHGFPGSLAAEELAVEHPNAIGGIVEIASIAVQAFPSQRDPNRQAAPEERLAAVNEGWAPKWFKYVTPETWDSNNYPVEMYANDASRAARARLEVEAAPLPVKIRYLTEFMASDHTTALNNLDVPLLVLKPGFDEKLLAEPGHAFFKTMLQDSWDPFSRNPRIQVMTIPNARALILDDEPAMADQAVAAWTRNVISSRR